MKRVLIWKMVGYLLAVIALIVAVFWGAVAFLQGGWWFLALIPASICLWLAAEFVDAVHGDAPDD